MDLQLIIAMATQPEVAWIYLALTFALAMRIAYAVGQWLGVGLHPRWISLPKRIAIPLGMLGTMIGLSYLSADINTLQDKLGHGLLMAIQTTVLGLLVVVVCHLLDHFNFIKKDIVKEENCHGNSN